MGPIIWILDIYQHTQIDKARTEAAGVRARTNRYGGRMDGVRAFSAVVLASPLVVFAGNYFVPPFPLPEG
ncbi:MAG: hypothetical protein O7B99_14530, partial [Planctomycetota bacterium]|nr:hypothetical protein [Planctomycetota bacterium]